MGEQNFSLKAKKKEQYKQEYCENWPQTKFKYSTCKIISSHTRFFFVFF